jgi:ankyrin repeat protein
MLNRIEKIIIDVYLYSIFQDIHGLSSSHKVMALEAIIAPNLAQETIDALESLKIWEHIKKLRDILSHATTHFEPTFEEQNVTYKDDAENDVFDSWLLLTEWGQHLSTMSKKDIVQYVQQQIKEKTTRLSANQHKEPTTYTLQSFHDAISSNDTESMEAHFWGLETLSKLNNLEVGTLITITIRTKDIQPIATLLKLILIKSIFQENSEEFYRYLNITLQKAIKNDCEDIVDYLFSIEAIAQADYLHQAVLNCNQHITIALINAGASARDAIVSAYEKFKYGEDKSKYQIICETLFIYAMGSDFYDEKFLYGLNLESICLFGISIAGEPITAEILGQYPYLKGQPLLSLQDIYSIPDEVLRREAIFRFNRLSAERGTLATADEIYNLVPFAKAVYNGKLATTKVRLHAGANPNETLFDKPLILIAMERQFFDIAKELAKHPLLDQNSLMQAIKICQHRNLLELETFFSDYLTNYVDDKGNTLLHLAVKNENIEKVKKFAKTHSTQATNSLRETPLAIAARKLVPKLSLWHSKEQEDKILKIMEILLQHPISLSGDDSSPISYAVEGQSPKAVRLLIPHLDKLDIHNKRKPFSYPWWGKLIFNAFAYHPLKPNRVLEILKILQQEGANLASPNPYHGNLSLLHTFVRYLIESINSTSNTRLAAGFFANPDKKLSKLLGLLQFLSEAGTTCLQDKYDQTPLHYLIQEVQLSRLSPSDQKIILENLIRTGEEIEINDNKGKTVIDYAKEKNNENIIPLLYEVAQEQKNKVASSLKTP